MVDTGLVISTNLIPNEMRELGEEKSCTMLRKDFSLALELRNNYLDI